MDDTNPKAVECREQDKQIAELDAGDDCILYDRRNHRAWLQSDGAVTVTDRR